MNKSVGSIVVLVVVIIVVLLVFRSCKQIEVRQKSDDRKTQFSVEIEKTREPRNQ